MLSDLEFLRRHVEAVWSIRLPALAYGDNEVLADCPAPSWSLYVGELAGGQVRIWRRDVAAHEYMGLTGLAMDALRMPAAQPAGDGINREVALRREAAPKIDVDTASQIARRLTAHDTPLLDTYYEDGADYLLASERSPIFGVIENGRLVSAAHSSRRTAEACELGVDTLAEARRRGYGLAVTVLWAEAVAAEGIEPIYSASATNSASLVLAHAAGFRPVVRGVNVTPARLPAHGETAPHQ